MTTEMDEAAGVPQWLQELPDVTPGPITVAMPQVLPFEHLTAENFERLVVRLADRDTAVERSRLYGVKGQDQHGIDLYCRLDKPGPRGRRYKTVQCRNVAGIAPNDVRALVDDFLEGSWADRTETFVLATRVSNLRTERAEAIEEAAERLDRVGIGFEVWDGEFLSVELRREPALVAVFFGEGTARDFCGESSPMPVRLGPRPPYFFGRDDLLSDIDSRLTAAAAGSPRQVVLHGIGGVGKTSAAVEYAYRHKERYGLIWQVSADNSSSLFEGFAELARLLGPHAAAGGEQPDPVHFVHASLAARPGRWLMILDNVGDQDGVHMFAPPIGDGDILITTQDGHWPGSRALGVPVMQRTDSVAFLTKRACDGDDVSADQLADLLSDLPLALEQAGAYAAASGCGIAGYIELFLQHRSKLLARRRPGTSSQQSVAATWAVAFARLAQQAPSALALLRLLAFYATFPIPLDRLFPVPEDLLAELAPDVADDMRPFAGDALAVNDAIAELGRYSMITILGRNTVGVHGLVQAATADEILPDRRHEWHRCASGLLLAALPDDPEDPATWPAYQALTPHALAALLAPDLKRVVMYLGAVGSYDTALVVQTHICGEAIERVGTQDAETVMAMAGLYYITGEAGDPSTARDGFRGLVKGCEGALEAEDHFLLTLRSNLARWTGEAGDPAGSCALYASLIPILEHALGDADPTTAKAKFNQAAMTLKAGHPAEAVALYRRLLPGYEDRLGADHPDTLDVVGNIACATGLAGDPSQACSLLVQHLEMMETVMGPTHPRTLIDRSNLAFMTAAAGDPLSARAQTSALLPVLESVFGEEHERVQGMRGFMRQVDDLIAAQGGC